jgi:hypothetical protein
LERGTTYPIPWHTLGTVELNKHQLQPETSTDQ